MLGVSLTHPVLAFFFFFFSAGSFSYTSHACLIFLWGVSLTHPMLVLLLLLLLFLLFKSGEFLLHIPCWLHIYEGNFSYTSRAGFLFFFSFYLGNFSYTFHACLSFLWGFSLTQPMLAFFFFFF